MKKREKKIKGLTEPEYKPFNPNPKSNYEMIRKTNEGLQFVISVFEKLGLLSKQKIGNETRWVINEEILLVFQKEIL